MKDFIGDGRLSSFRLRLLPGGIGGLHDCCGSARLARGTEGLVAIGTCNYSPSDT